MINWPMAITRNRDALLRIVEALFVMAGLGEGDSVATLPRHLRNYLLRILRPAESAVRRLVIIAARELVVVVGPVRTKTTTTTPTDAHPSRSVILGLEPRTHSVKTDTAAKAKNPALPLLDSLPIFSCRPPRRRPKSFPRLTFLGLSDPIPIPDDWIPSPDDAMDATGLRRRLVALKRALDDLDGHARRLARWKAKRDLGLNRSKRFHPMRPGRPPGHRKRAVHEVDDVLRECHALALHARREDTS